MACSPCATPWRSSAMTTHERFLPRGPVAASNSLAPLGSWIKSIGLRLTAWAETCADYYAAAAMYEHLSGMSDAELARRGLSRATLAHDVRTECDRSVEREPTPPQPMPRSGSR